VLDVLRRNIRQPEEVVGDIESLVAAAKLGAGRLMRLGEDMGTGSLLASIADIISYATERGRHEIEGLGTAEAEFVDYLDDDHVSEEPVRIKVHLRIADGQVNCDFSGSSRQVKSGLNSVVGTTRSVVQWAVRTQMSEDFPDNHGFYSLVTLKTEPGTVVDARDDAPVAGRALTAFRVGDAIMGALAQMFPGRIPAIGDGSMNPLTFGGRRDDGTTFVAHDVLGGNTGGGPHADGTEGVAPAIGNARNVSVELLEAYAPVRVVRYGFKPDTGGRGRYRGGNSIVREYELLCDEAEVYIRNDRQKFPPWGLEGGGSGKPSANLLVRAGGELETLPSKFVFRMRRGDRLTWLGPGGGGYGDPAERDPVETERDRREGRFVDG
jgi:N-methylhydantoinase B